MSSSKKLCRLTHQRLWRVLPVCLCLLWLSGCATKKQLLIQNTINQDLSRGQVSSALSALEAGKNRNILYQLEKGELTTLTGPEGAQKSTADFLSADQQVSRWFISAKERLAKAGSTVAGFLLGEGMGGDYEVKDYEISLISYRLAIHHLLDNQWNNAMVAARKMADRETLISQSKKLANQQINDEVKAKGSAAPSFENIQGYPVNTLKDPAVLALKNSYQSAAAHYLAGFVYESQKEVGLAAPGYRLAIELRPDVPMLRESLANLDANIRRAGDGTTDTLFIVETGVIPNMRSQTSAFPLLSFGVGKVISISLPVIDSTTDVFDPGQLQVGKRKLPTAKIADLDLMSRRWLKDAMPAYIWRAVSRAITSVASQYMVDRAVSKAASTRTDSSAADLLGSVAGFLTGLTFTATTVSDVRHWASLPARVYLARGRLPRGANSLLLNTPRGTKKIKLNLQGEYGLVYIRFVDNEPLVMFSGAAKPAMSP